VLGRASGKVWVDHVQLFEIKPESGKK